MKTINALIIFLSSLIMLSVLSSCEDENELNYEFFLIEVDSIQVPENISINEPFDISFSGTIGGNGCYQFSRFDTGKQGNDIIIKAWGRFNKSQRLCTSVIVSLDNEKLTYRIDEKGTYTIKVLQADNSFLEKQISVE